MVCSLIDYVVVERESFFMSSAYLETCLKFSCETAWCHNECGSRMICALIDRQRAFIYDMVDG